MVRWGSGDMGGEKRGNGGRERKDVIISNLSITLTVPLKCDPAQGSEQDV